MRCSSRTLPKSGGGGFAAKADAEESAARTSEANGRSAECMARTLWHHPRITRHPTCSVREQCAARRVSVHPLQTLRLISAAAADSFLWRRAQVLRLCAEPSVAHFTSNTP